jgi:hypothetical protein
MYWSKPLPPANWKRPKARTGKLSAGLIKDIENERLRLALEKIAKGDNDPRTTAMQALGWHLRGARP